MITSRQPTLTYSSLPAALATGGAALRLCWLTALAYLALATILVVEAQSQTEDNNERLSKVVAELEKLEKRLSRDSARVSSIDKTVRETEREIGRIASRQQALNADIRQLQRQLDQLARKQAAQQTEQRQQQASVAEQIRLAYQLGSQNPLQLFFEQSEPSAVGRQLTYLDYANRARVDKIEAYMQTIAELESTRQEKDARAKELSEARQALAEQEQSMLSLQQRRRAQLDSLKDDIQTAEQRATALRQEQQQLEQLLREVTDASSELRETAPRGDFARAKGKLPWPVNGKLRYRYGSNRPNSDIPWQGVTIGASEGTEVSAIFPGRVVFADWFKGQGLLIIVDHGNGYMSLYSHAQSLLKQTGEQVDAGEPIATVGSSGAQQRAALYFEIRHNGAPRDPDKWCS